MFGKNCVPGGTFKRTVSLVQFSLSFSKWGIKKCGGDGAVDESQPTSHDVKLFSACVWGASFIRLQAIALGIRG
ncbi:hypothetical protein VNO78_16486 [Psophocarpus tetragonolobus]|uniref:Uncharacterized protein n=1 Tax=Psophocarpus tetragonolobus TaxID=3891 RepID=A0AAN9SI02_PSOTE